MVRRAGPLFRTLLSTALIGVFGALSPGLLEGQSGTEVSDLTLEDLLNQTVSTASKYAQKSRDAPANITIITSEEIQRYGFRNLAEALQMLTSFSVGTDHSYTYTAVRGIARPADYNNRVLVLLDGHTHNENVLGASEIGSLRFLDVSEVERVEVVRGPGSSLYGTRAMFAVVNVITKKGSDIDGARAWSEMGSFGHRMAGVQFGRLFANGLDLTLTGGWSDSDGEDLYFPEFDSPDTNNGVAEGLNWGELTRGGVSLEHGGWRVWGAIYDRMKGTPSAPHMTVFNDPRSKFQDKAWILDMEYEKELSASSELTLRTYANKFQTHHVYPRLGNKIDIRLKAAWIGSEARLLWDIKPSHRVVLGGEIQWTPVAEWNMDDELGDARFDGDYPYSIASIFLQDEFQVTSELALTLGVRHDEYSSSRRATTPRVGIVYHPWQTSTLKVLWGTAFRAPNIYELNFESAYVNHLSNPELESEIIQSAEVVWEQRLAKGLMAKVGIFRNDISHLIDQVGVVWPEDWPPSPIGAPFALQFQNGRDVRAQGIEAELNGAFASRAMGYVRYAYQRVEEPESGFQAPNYPAHSVKVGGTHRLGDLLNVGANFLWESERKTLAGTETEGYSVLDASIQSPLILDHVTLSLTAKNLLDTEYSLPSGPQHSLIAIPQPSRSLLFRAGVVW